MGKKKLKKQWAEKEHRVTRSWGAKEEPLDA